MIKTALESAMIREAKRLLDLDRPEDGERNCNAAQFQVLGERAGLSPEERLLCSKRLAEFETGRIAGLLAMPSENVNTILSNLTTRIVLRDSATEFAG